MKISTQHDRVPNRILSALPALEYQRLIKDSKHVTLAITDRLYEPNEPIRHVHFILSGIGSVVSTMEEGTSIEVMIVGWEGMVGLHALDLPDAIVPTEAFMQISGSSLQIPAATIREEFKRGGKFQSLMLPYMHFVLLQVSQSAACNRLHNLEERLCRWLLMVHDRLRVNAFELTHEFLAQMLGTRRSSVTLAAGILQQAGFLNYKRGRVQILDRNGLEGAACQCYSNVKQSWDRLIKMA